MSSTENQENVKTNEKEKRNLMYSQIFNYNMVSRDHMSRPIDVSAAVEGGGKDIENKKSRLTALAILGVFGVFWLILGVIASFIN